MSSINALGGSSQWNISSLTQVQGGRVSSGASDDSSGTEGVDKPKGRHHEGSGGLMGDIAQVLQQMGLSFGGTPASDASGTSSDSAPGQDGPPPPPPEGNSTVGDAMHTLMHDLFQAVKEANGSSSSASNEASSAGSDSTDASSTSTQGYDNFETGLQKVLQQLSSDSGSELSNKLTADLQKLVSAFSSSSSNEPSAADVSGSSSLNVQDFLGALQQRLAQHGNNHGSGDGFGSQGQLFAASA